MRMESHFIGDSWSLKFYNTLLYQTHLPKISALLKKSQIYWPLFIMSLFIVRSIEKKLSIYLPKTLILWFVIPSNE